MSKTQAKKLPEGFFNAQYVKFKTPNFKKHTLGVVAGVCKYDGGIKVWIPTEASKYECVKLGDPGVSIIALTPKG